MGHLLQSMEELAAKMDATHLQDTPRSMYDHGGSYDSQQTKRDIVVSVMDGFLHMLNNGSKPELLKLKNFGIKRVEAAIEFRKKRKFTSVKDVMRIGMSAANIKRSIRESFSDWLDKTQLEEEDEEEDDEEEDEEEE